jgi:diacylglycerol kinase (ATP)
MAPSVILRPPPNDGPLPTATSIASSWTCRSSSWSTEGAVLDDGFLDVVIIKPITKPDLVRTYPKLFKGTHVTIPQYEHHRVRRVTVAAPGIVSYADGERFGPLPLTIECAPGALTVFA